MYWRLVRVVPSPKQELCNVGDSLTICICGLSYVFSACNKKVAQYGNAGRQDTGTSTAERPLAILVIFPVGSVL